MSNPNVRDDMIELGKLLLDDETAAAFSEWLHGLAEQQHRELREAAAAKEEDERDERRYEQVRALAFGIAERHGLLKNMDPWEQAKAACASWEAQAGYFDVDEQFVMDDNWREIWQGAYVDGLQP